MLSFLRYFSSSTTRQRAVDWFDWQKLFVQVVTTLIFLVIGLACFALSDWFISACCRARFARASRKTRMSRWPS